MDDRLLERYGSPERGVLDATRRLASPFSLRAATALLPSETPRA